MEQLPKLEGKKMFLFLAPKKVGVAKKSQQKLDRERREAENKEAGKAQDVASQDVDIDVETPANGGLFANIKGGDELLKKLKDSNED